MCWFVWALGLYSKFFVQGDWYSQSPGSSVGGVVILLSKDFTKIVVIAFVLAVPLSWWMMDKWLEGFAYRVTVDFTSFAIAGLLALGIALITVSYQSIKAAL